MAVINIVKDNNGNVIYEEHDDGYKEINNYNDKNKLIRSEMHFSNGMIEVETYKDE